MIQKPDQKNADSRKTIGYALHDPIENFNYELWSGVEDAAKNENINVICFSWGEINSPYQRQVRRNVIYNLIDKENVNGLVLAANILSNFIGVQKFRKYCEGFHLLPITSIGIEMEGIPSVILDEENKFININFVKNLLSWKNSGFSIDNSVRIFGSDEKARESLAQYIAKCPISPEKLKYESFHSKVLFKTPKYNDYFKENFKVYGTHPLTYPVCGSEMRILSIIMYPVEVNKVHRHLYIPFYKYSIFFLHMPLLNGINNY